MSWEIPHRGSLFFGILELIWKTTFFHLSGFLYAPYLPGGKTQGDDGEVAEVIDESMEVRIDEIMLRL